MSLKARLRALERRTGPPDTDPYAGQRKWNAACRKIYGKPGDEDEEEEFTMTDEEAHAAFMEAAEEIYAEREAARVAENVSG